MPTSMPPLGRRAFLRSLALGASAVGLAACGGGQSAASTPAVAPTSGNQPAATTGATSKAATPQAATGKVQIVLAHYLDPATKRVYDTEIKAFNGHYPNISIRQDVSPEGEFTGKMLTQFGGGLYPDVMMLTDRYVPDFAQRNQLLVIDPYIKRDSAAVDIADMNKDLVLSGNWKGKQLGLFDYTGPLVMYYNRRLWQQAGVAIPTGTLPGYDLTFTQLTDIAKKLTTGSGPNKIYGMVGFGNSLVIQVFMAWSYGTQILNGRGPHTAAETKWTWDSKEMREALQLQTDWILKDGSVFKPGEIQGDAFVAQRAVITNFGGRFLTPTYSRLPWASDLGMIMAPTGPTGKKQTRNGPRGLFIPKGAKHPEEAWQLVKYITGTEAETIAFQGNYSTPARHSLWPVFDKHKMPWENTAVYRKSQDIMEAAGPMPTIPNFAACNKIIGDQLNALWLGTQNVDVTVKQLDQQLTAQMQAPV